MEPRSTVRQGNKIGYTTRKYPEVRGGICEKCGVLNPNADSQDQYRLCEHYRGVNLECNYCDPTKDQREVTRVSVLHMFDHPSQKGPDGRPALGVVCDSFNCQNAFQAEYKR